MKKLINEIHEVLKASDENVLMLIKDIHKSEAIYRCHSDKKVVSASTIKVPIMLAVLEEVHKKTIMLEDRLLVTKEDILSDTNVFEHGEKAYSIYELLHWMIIESDNTATNVLIKSFGMKQINDYMRNALGTKTTLLQRLMLDEQAIKNGLNNYTSQEDLCHMFTKLFHKEILNQELCDIAIEILYRQRCQDQLMRYIYEPVKFAHKTGNLDYLNHDIGVMNIKNKQYYIGISIYDSPHKEGNKALIGTLGKMVYDFLNQDETTL